MSYPVFRPDIEGLRGIAVLAVLAFHLAPSWMPGGFQGVDIFFVLSGYLITGIIRREGESFSFQRFYLRRFWRLFPSLIVTIICSLVAGFILLIPVDYETLGLSGLAAAVGVSNFFFYSHLDYFNDNVLTHPLLHTWSLGVEEQFYLFWPLILVWARRRISFEALVTALLFSGGILVLYAAPKESDLAFYMMPFRIVEFAAGAGVLLCEARMPRQWRFAGGLLGVSLIAAGLLLIDDNRVWPGPSTVVPVLGTVLLLWAGTSRSWTAVLGNHALRFFGRISYVLYLVHWPILVFYAYWRVVPLNTLELVALAVSSVLAATLIHIFVETPFREGRTVPFLVRTQRLDNILASTVAKNAAIVLITLATFSAATAIAFFQGFPGRVAGRMAQKAGELSYAGDICRTRRGSRCVLGDGNSPRKVYVVGDSHAGNLFYGLDALFREWGIKGIAVMDDGCLFLFQTMRFNKGQPDERCRRSIADVYSVMNKDRAPIIFAGRMTGYRGAIGGMNATAPLSPDEKVYYRFLRKHLVAGLRYLHADQRPILLVKSAFSSGTNLRHCFMRWGSTPLKRDQFCRPWNIEQNRTASGRADALLEEMEQQFAKVDTLDPKAAFCDQRECKAMENNIFLLRDRDHLTNEGSLFLVRKLSHEILPWLEKSLQDKSLKNVTIRSEQ